MAVLKYNGKILNIDGGILKGPSISGPTNLHFWSYYDPTYFYWITYGTWEGCSGNQIAQFMVDDEISSQTQGCEMSYEEIDANRIGETIKVRFYDLALGIYSDWVETIVQSS